MRDFDRSGARAGIRGHRSGGVGEACVPVAQKRDRAQGETGLVVACLHERVLVLGKNDGFIRRQTAEKLPNLQIKVRGRL